jgi:hypothetical protein
MKEIGGYLGFCSSYNNVYYKKTVPLNSGRNAFKYILLAKKIKKVYLPFYICDSIITTLKKNSITFEHYPISENLEPIFNKKLLPDEVILCVNYFGICDKIIDKVLDRFHPNVIVDNAQAFFSTPHKKVSTFYSPRKFFGVPDGGYAICDQTFEGELTKDDSHDRVQYLFKRIESGAESGFNDYCRNEKLIAELPMRNMSNTTCEMLRAINYKKVNKIRIENFLYLHSYIGRINRLHIANDINSGPLCYPFLTDQNDLRAYLIYNKVFVPAYWQEVLEKKNSADFEHRMAESLVPIPIDQRYSKNDLDKILNLLRSYHGNLF